MRAERALLWALALTGCATEARVSAGLRETQSAAEALREQLLAGARPLASTRRTTPKLAGERIPVHATPEWPSVLREDFFYTTSGQSLERILSNLSEQTGLSIRTTELSERPSAARALDPTRRLGRAVLDVAWSGPLSGLLDQLARDTDMYWRFVPSTGGVELYRYETRHFSVNVPMGTRAVAGGISSSGSGAQAGAGAAQRPGAPAPQGQSMGTGSIGVQLADLVINPFAAITRTITSMLLEDDPEVDLLGGAAAGQQGATGATGAVQPQGMRAGVGAMGAMGRQGMGAASRVVVSPELAMVTVTASPPTLERVAAYLKQVNEQFARNVTIDVRVYDVALDDETGLGFSLETLYQSMGSFGLSLTGGPAVPFGRGPAGQLTFEVANPAARFNGSQLLGQALARFGAVSVSTSGQVLAVNGQPAPFQVADEISYLASTSVRADRLAGGGVVDGLPGLAPLVVDLTPGSVVVGLTANFLPQILEDNRILLQYQLTVSELRSLTTVTSGAASIQTPNVFTQSLQQQAVLRDGQSIVLFGYGQDRAERDTRISIGGSNRTSGEKRNLRVIQIQVFGGGTNA